MHKRSSENNTCNRIDLQEEKFTQEAVARLHPTHSLAEFTNSGIAISHFNYCSACRIGISRDYSSSAGLFYEQSENTVKHRPLSVSQLDLSLERQLTIVIKLVRLHLLFTGWKYVSGTSNLTC